MGIIPPYDPFVDGHLRWALARVESIDSPTATWGRPALVTLAVVGALKGSLPERLEVLFDAPREAGQMYFHAQRDYPPWEPGNDQKLRERTAQLDAMGIELPTIGDTLIVWLSPPAPPHTHWTIPTLRLFDRPDLPLHSRWIDATPEAIQITREHLQRGSTPTPTPLQPPGPPPAPPGLPLAAVGPVIAPPGPPPPPPGPGQAPVTAPAPAGPPGSTSGQGRG